MSVRALAPLSAAIALLPLVAALTACGGDTEPSEIEEVVETLLVDHYRVPCEGEGRQLCLRIRPETGDKWLLEYEAIEGFEYHWGSNQLIRVREVEVVDPPADGSSTRLELVEILSELPVSRGNRFELEIEPGDLVDATEADAPGLDFTLVGERGVVCAGEIVCIVLRGRAAKGLPATVIFGHERESNRLKAFEVK